MNRGPTELQSSHVHHVSVTVLSWSSLGECIMASAPWGIGHCVLRHAAKTKAPTRQLHVMAPRSHGFYSLAAQSLRRMNLGAGSVIAIASLRGRASGSLRASIFTR